MQQKGNGSHEPNHGLNSKRKRSNSISASVKQRESIEDDEEEFEIMQRKIEKFEIDNPRKDQEIQNQELQM